MKEKSKKKYSMQLFILLFAVIGFYFYFKKTPPAVLNLEQVPLANSPAMQTSTKVLKSSMEKNPLTKVSESPKKILNPETIASIRSHLKMNLAMLYTGEKSFKAEYGRYTTDLVSVGLSPQKEELNYKMGFLNEYFPQELADMGGSQEDPSRMSTDVFVNQLPSDSSAIASYSELATSINLQNYSRFCEHKCSVSKDGFEMIIVAKFSSDQEDVWIIDQDKNMFQVKDGVTGKELAKPYKKK